MKHSEAEHSDAGLMSEIGSKKEARQTISEKQADFSSQIASQPRFLLSFRKIMSRDSARTRSSEDLSNGKLLKEIKNISNALQLDKSSSRSSSSSATKHKKSFWSWKPLKALSHVKHRRFNCCFTLEVHTIEALPSKFDDLHVCVYWERKDGEVVTHPVKVTKGVAEFEEKLTHTCSICVSRNGPHNSVKYDLKNFLLYATIYENPNLDLGKHRVDLTRILPSTFEELEDGNSSGTWTKSFKLSGEAEGGVMNISFEYRMLGPLGDGIGSNSKTSLQPFDSKSTAKSSVKNLPANQKSSMTSRSMDDINILHEVPPTRIADLSDSINIVYQKLDEEKVGSPIDVKHEIVFAGDDCDSLEYSEGSPSSPSNGPFLNKYEDAEISFAKHRSEVPEPMKYSDHSISDPSEGPPVNEPENTEFSFSGKRLDMEENTELNGNGNGNGEKIIDNDVGNSFDEEGNAVEIRVIHDTNTEVKDISTEESLLEDRESVSGNIAELEKDGIATPEVRSESSDQGNQDRDRKIKTIRSVSFNSDLEPESPRERLLREFFKEVEACGSSLLASGSSRIGSSRIGSSRIGFDFDDDDEEEYVCYPPITSGSQEFPKGSDSLPIDESEYPKIRAKVMIDEGTQELDDDWDLEEEASFPPLGEGLGLTIQTNTGGFLRSMNPVHFRNAKSGGSLIMQVSSPVVVPAEMGFGVMDVLQKLTSMGLEKLSLQAKRIMPLDDMIGKTIQQMGWEAVPKLEASKRQNLLQDEHDGDQITSGDEEGAEFVALEELTPLAMDKIEELLIEGLRISSGMSDEESPSNITTQSISEFPILEGKRVTSTGPISMGFEGIAGLQLLDFTDTKTDDNDGEQLLDLSLTLDEWIRLDFGEIDDNLPSERTSKLLVAHHASSIDSDFRRGKHASRRCGLLGSNFTIAFMVQLHDPLRDYESVGTPMLALIQVDRTIVPRIYCRVTNARDNNDDLVSMSEEDKTQEFSILEVHVAGLKGESGNKKVWGNEAQQQSGSRWLVTNRLGKENEKSPLMSPKILSKYPLPATVMSHHCETLWSISARNCGSEAKYKELASLNPHIRNPDIILSNETIKLW